LPAFGAKLEAWRFKNIHTFNFSQFHVVFGIVNSFLGIFDAISSEKSCPTSMLFLLTYIVFRTQDFSRLLNSDWSIHISDAAAVYKVGAET